MKPISKQVELYRRIKTELTELIRLQKLCERWSGAPLPIKQPEAKLRLRFENQRELVIRLMEEI